jgi:hypothetical protein
VLAQSSRQFPGPQTATVELLLLLSSGEEETRPSTLTTTQHKKTDKTKTLKATVVDEAQAVGIQQMAAWKRLDERIHNLLTRTHLQEIPIFSII